MFCRYIGVIQMQLSTVFT